MVQNINTDFFELSSKKLFLNIEKCKSILDVVSRKIICDPVLPISIELHLTNKCNLNCKWCVDREIRKNSCDLPFDAARSLVNEIANTNIGITLEGGGEPTIYHSFKELVVYAAERNTAIGLISNGVKSFDKDLVKYFKWIRISVDAATSQEYLSLKGFDQFENVLYNIGEICKNKTTTLIGVSYVLTRYNYMYISKLLWRIQDLGVDYIQIRIVEENENMKLNQEMLSEVENEIINKFFSSTLRVLFNRNIERNNTNNDNLPCVAHSLRSIVHADGFVYLCEKRRHDPVVLGNIIRHRFIDLWNSQIRLDASEKLRDKKNQIGCSVCRITNFNHLFCSLNDVKTKNFI